jgi:hypothetical protein
VHKPQLSLGLCPLDQRSYRQLCLTGYFRGILRMEGASGVTQVIAPPRKNRDKIPIVTALPIDEPSVADPPPAAPAPPPPAVAAEAAAAAAAAAPACGGGNPALPSIKFFLFELVSPSAAVVQQLSSEPAGQECCSSGERKSLILECTMLYCILYHVLNPIRRCTCMYSYVPCMLRTYPLWNIKVYTFLRLYIDVHTRTYFRVKVYTGIYRDIRFRS